MKHFLLFVLIITIITFSCRYDCDRASALVALVGFQPNESDTVVVRKFDKMSNFSSLVDSFPLDASNSHFYQKNDTLEISATFGTDRGLLGDYDYEIYLPEINRVFRVSEIKEDFRSIGNFLSCTKEGCENSFKSYKVNGDLINVGSSYLFYFEK